MIAPADFSQELELYLYVSGSFQKQFDLKPRNLPRDSELELPSDWWSVWRAELMQVDEAGEFSYVLFTNAKTLFSFVCRGYRDDYESIIGEFAYAFLSCLKGNGLQLPPPASLRISFR